MEKSNKPQAKLLFERVKAEFSGVSVTHTRARILKLLEDGNRELLPPDGITDKTNLSPDLPWWRSLANLNLPSEVLVTDIENDARFTTYVLKVIEIFRRKFGVILYKTYAAGSCSNPTVVRSWIYPKKRNEKI